jgi:tetratricopeptide (TPR) repeat protein
VGRSGAGEAAGSGFDHRPEVVAPQARCCCRYEEAAAAFERVVQLQPDSARGYQRLGTALQAAGRNDDALQQYEKAITIRPSGRTYSNIGTLYFWRGEYPSAIKAYENAVALLPNDPALRANLGDAYAKVGEFARATQSYRQAVADVERFLRISPADAQDRLEPPCTDPYARWCGRGRRVTAAPMPINASLYRQMRKAARLLRAAFPSRPAAGVRQGVQ